MPQRVYDADIYRFNEVPQNHWRSTAGSEPIVRPLDRDLEVDVAVIGGGYAGLSAAKRLAERHGIGVAVLEAGRCIGWGASGLNGGFVATGGNKLEIAAMVRRAGEAETRRFWTTQTAAVAELRDFIDRSGADCEVAGDGNLCVAHHPGLTAALAEEAAMLAKRYGVAAEFIPAERFRSEVHRGPETFGALNVRPGFGVHPVRLVQALARAAIAAGVDLRTSAEVVGWTREGARHRLAIASGASVRAARVVMATNAYTPNGLRPALDFRSLPAISSIIVTQAYGAAELDARGFRSQTPIYNSRELLSYYRRLPDGRLLFGMRGDTRGTAEAARRQAEATLTELHRVLPDFADARIDHAWRGLVCLTVRRTLAVGLDPDDATVAFAFGCQGSGVATMHWAGRLAADLVAGAAGDADVPALFTGLPPRLPRSNLALRWGLRAAYATFALRDAVHV